MRRQRANDQADSLDKARKRVEGHLNTTLSTAPTEPYRDYSRDESEEPAVLVVEGRPIVLGDSDPDRDLRPRGAPYHRADPELRGAVRDLADAVALLLRVVAVMARRQAPWGCLVLLVAASLALGGAGIGGAVVAAWMVLRW